MPREQYPRMSSWSENPECCNRNPGRRDGLTLVEVIIAILVFSVGGLGLAASSAVIVRQMSSSDHRGRSASIARARDETFHASACGSLSGGEDTRSGVRSVWRVSPGTATTLDQELTRAAMSATRSDQYLSAVPCE